MCSVMKEPKLYGTNNKLPRQAVRDVLKEFSPRMQWKMNKTVSVLDVGCGDGGLTADLLLPYLPKNCKLTGCDVGAEMIEHAKMFHNNEYSEFRILDIVGDVPKNMLESYDHVFSSFTLHWVQEQNKAFTNIYNMMIPGGNCLLIFLVQISVFSAYKVLKRTDKWSNYLSDAEQAISPYNDSVSPEEEVANLMKEIGFKYSDVKCKKLTFISETIDMLRNLLRGVNPFYKHIPFNLREEFLDDLVDEVRNLCVVDGESTQFDYTLLVAYGVK